MKTLQQFVPQLFSDYSDSLTHITEKQTKLSGIAAQSSTFQNAVNVAKLVSAQTNSSKFAVNILDSVFTMVDYDFTYKNDVVTPYIGKRFDHVSLDKDEASEAFYTMVDLLTVKLGNNTVQEVGYYDGVPIYCLINSEQVQGAISYPNNVTLELYFGKKTIDGNDYFPKPFLAIKAYPSTINTRTDIRAYSDAIDNDDVFNLKGQAIVEGVTIDDWYVGSCDTLLNAIFNDYISNECVGAIIKRAQTDGVITRDQIESILNQFQETNISTSIRTLIAGTGKLDSISLITLIGKLYKNMGASYSNDQTDTFTVYDVPTFITSIIQCVVSLLLSVVAIVLSIIWHTIGVIISLIMTVVSYIVELVQKNAVKTNANIVDTSLTPIINNPLLTFQMNSIELELYLARYFNDTSLSDIDEVLQEYGCAMIAPQYVGSAPYYLWILPRDYNNVLSKYTLQFLVSATPYALNGAKPADINITCNSITQYQLPGVTAYYTDDIGALLQSTGSWVPTYSGCRDSEYRYTSLSDENMRLSVTANTMKALNDILSYSSTDIIQSFHPSSGHLYITEIVHHDNLTEVNTLDEDKYTLTNLLKIVNSSLNQNYFTTTLSKLKFLTVFFSTYVDRMIGGLNTAPTWDELTDLFNLVRQLESEFVSFSTTRLGVYTNARLKYENLQDGHTLASPAVEWPNLSKKALINALIVTGVTCAAVAGIAVGLKLGLKKVAFNKLASRQAKFDAASDEYKKMQKAISADKKNMGGYSKAQINSITSDYYKANKKLTRAWSFAGKFGLSMFNGFSTSSSSSAFTESAASSPLSSLTSTNYQNNVSGSPAEQVNVNDIDMMGAILNAVTFR